MCASSSRCPITGVSMEEGQELICPVCNAPVKLTEPVGPPMADHRVAHLRCWIRKRQGMTVGTAQVSNTLLAPCRKESGRGGPAPRS